MQISNLNIDLNFLIKRMNMPKPVFFNLHFFISNTVLRIILYLLCDTKHGQPCTHNEHIRRRHRPGVRSYRIVHPNSHVVERILGWLTV